jgi:hypothetical protein
MGLRGHLERSITVTQWDACGTRRTSEEGWWGVTRILVKVRDTYVTFISLDVDPHTSTLPCEWRYTPMLRDCHILLCNASIQQGTRHTTLHGGNWLRHKKGLLNVFSRSYITLQIWTDCHVSYTDCRYHCSITIIHGAYIAGYSTTIDMNVVIIITCANTGYIHNCSMCKSPQDVHMLFHDVRLTYVHSQIAQL